MTAGCVRDKVQKHFLRDVNAPLGPWIGYPNCITFAPVANTKGIRHCFWVFKQPISRHPVPFLPGQRPWLVGHWVAARPAACPPLSPLGLSVLQPLAAQGQGGYEAHAIINFKRTSEGGLAYSCSCGVNISEREHSPPSGPPSVGPGPLHKQPAGSPALAPLLEFPWQPLLA